MAVERNPDLVPVNELIDLLVIREIMGHEQAVDEVHIRHQPGTPDFPAIDRHQLDDPVRIPQGERQRGTVEVNNHAGDGGIDICRNPVVVPENNAGQGIAVVPEIFFRQEQPRADMFRDFNPAVRDGYQERGALFHRYQQGTFAGNIC